ncbi:MAG: aspartate/glutamate racemase family protein [Promethearchaeota archaeon]
MKTIGLIGGITWLSSQEYYRIINETMNERLGRLHSAKIILFSVDFEEIVQKEKQGKRQQIAELLIDAAKKIEKAGADFLVVCANTAHKFTEEISKAITIPLLHIADVTAEKVKQKNLRKVGFVGTKYTMEKEFYIRRLIQKHRLELILPTEEERQIIDDVIYKELAIGEKKESSKEKYKEIIHRLIEKGAEGIILGCTEIPLLLEQKDVKVPIFDTTMIHAQSAVDLALKE